MKYVNNLLSSYPLMENSAELFLWADQVSVGAYKHMGVVDQRCWIF